MPKITELTPNDFKEIIVTPQQSDEWIELILSGYEGIKLAFRNIIKGVCIRNNTNTIIALGGVANFNNGIFAFAFVSIFATKTELVKAIKYARDCFLPEIKKPIYVSAKSNFCGAKNTLKFIGFKPLNIQQQNAEYENWVME